MKYTALLAAPILLIALDGPITAGWRARRWVVTVCVALVIAGPWYLRNWCSTGNPLFPLDVSVLGIHLFHGLFSAAPSESFKSFGSAAAVVVGGSYGLPTPVVFLLSIGWLAAAVVGIRSRIREPLFRACVLGPVIGIAIFFWRSPFPEVRFIVPEFLLLFALAGIAIEQGTRRISATPALTLIITSIVPIVSLGTIFVPGLWSVVAPFIEAAVVVATIAGVVFWLIRGWTIRRRVALIIVTSGFLISGFAYVNWTAYCQSYQRLLHADGAGYDQQYPKEEKLWRFVDEHVPADATVAYANLYLVYPLSGFELRRRLIYVPTRPGLRTMADLPWLGERLSGEKLVVSATRATVAVPDHAVWLKNLEATEAKYLIVGRGGVISDPPEKRFIDQDPKRFRLLFEGPTGSVYQIESS